MPNDLTVLADNRDALLLAEVGAWLHMLGKFHEDFLRGDHDLDTQIPDDLTTDYSALDALLRGSWPDAVWKTLPNVEPPQPPLELSLFSLIEHHRNKKAPKGLLQLMEDAHGRGSGIEKGVLNRFAPGQENAVYLASAVGCEEDEPIALADLSTRRNALYAFLTERLTQLRDHNAHVDWNAFRAGFIKRLVDDFSASVAETRRPLNDVTLFDQTAASVAFFKAGLAQVLLRGWKVPTAKAIEDPYRWRILRVGLDGLAFWGQAARASDLRARKGLVGDALDKVRRLLEETYPLGMEIYRDENGSAFIVPDVEDLLDLDAKGSSLRDHLQAIATKDLAGETGFALGLSCATRNTLLFGTLVSEPPAPPAPSPGKLAEVWEGVKDRDVCPVCGQRPQGPRKKALDRKMCDICEQRRLDRAEEWIGKLGATIWIDEAADASGKVALVVGRFGLERWLSGEAWRTVLAVEPSSRSLTDEKRNNKEYPFAYDSFLSEATLALSPREAKQKFGKRTPLLDNLLLDDSRGDLDYFRDIYDLYVSDTDLSGPSAGEAWRFALALMRQQPAFARIRRLWETTQGFWEDVMGELGQGEPPIVPPVAPRLRIPLASTHELGVNHVYELRIGDTTLAVVRTADALLSADNLQRVAKLLRAERDEYATSAKAAEFVQKRLVRQEKCAIDEPSEYGRPAQLRDTIATTAVEVDPTPYQPIIPILADPRSFMALVPADRALAVAVAIREKYEREMGKVRNRLPLHLGLVFADARQPLRALLDAGRRMLAYQGRPADATWRVQGVATVGNDCMVRLAQADGEGGQRALTWRVPLKMGDAKMRDDGTPDDGTPDDWYPYVFVATDGDDSKVADRTRRFKGPRPGTPDPCWLVHAACLAVGDEVYFTPATLDVQWLDAAARRFEIAYDDDRRRLTMPRRPYLLDDLATFEALAAVLGRGLSASQRHALRDAIEAKRDAWQPQGEELQWGGTFWQFCRDAIATAEWKQGPPSNLKEWADHAARGTLTDIIELYERLDLFPRREAASTPNEAKEASDA